MRTKDKVKVAGKLVVGTALLVYVLRSGMIDFAKVKTALLTPANLVAAVCFLLVSVLCCSLRWFVLARAQGLSLSLWSVVELTMIGNFFNTFMPGAVGGDLIKAWYVAGREPQRRTRAIFTVLLDRVIGLAVFFLFAGFALLLHFEWLASYEELRRLAYAIWAIAAALLVVAALFFSPAFPRLKPLHATLAVIRRQERLGRILDAALLYRDRLKTVLGAVALSCLAISATVMLFRVQGELLGVRMGLSEYYFVVPVALTVSAIPLLPGGIGVGQVAFYTLFQWLGQANPEQGSTLCTIFQVYTILFNCLGAVFYVRFKREPGISPCVPATLK